MLGNMIDSKGDCVCKEGSLPFGDTCVCCQMVNWRCVFIQGMVP